MSYHDNVTIQNIEISSYKDAIYAYNSNDNLLIGNTIKNNIGSGIWLDGALRCNITDNIVEHNENGIVCIGIPDSNFNCITNNFVCYNNGIGIDVHSDNIIEDNVVEGNGVNYNIVLISETPTPTLSPTATPSSSPEPTSTPTPESEFPTTTVIASVAILSIVTVGILAYYKKYRK